jgi:hypothetical protein
MGEAWKDRFFGEFQCAQCGALYAVAITRLSAPVLKRPDANRNNLRNLSRVRNIRSLDVPISRFNR